MLYFIIGEDMTNWEVKYNILKNIYQKNGSINDIHQGDVIVLDGVEHKIGSFLSDQRKLYNKYLKIDDNKKDKKVLEHIRLLEELGIDWNPKETEWLNKYKLLVDYKNKYGDLNVPYTYVSNGEKLGVFVANQRSIYRKNKNKRSNLSLHKYFLQQLPYKPQKTIQQSKSYKQHQKYTLYQKL